MADRTQKQKPSADSPNHTQKPSSQLNDTKSSTTPDITQTPKFADTPMSPEKILQLQRLIGNRATMQLLGRSQGKVQRAFQPATTTAKTHFRKGGANVKTDTKMGRNIPSGSELIIDQSDTQVDGRETWTRAVDVKAEEWNPATSMLHGGYIRGSKVTPVTYPKTVGKTKILWNEALGEYTEVEDSLEGDGKKIIKLSSTGGYSSLDSTDFTQSKLSSKERSQIQSEREKQLAEQLEVILTKAASDVGVDPSVIASEENIKKFIRIPPETIEDREKFGATRPNLGTGSLDAKGKWYDWSQRVLKKIANGAAEVMESVMHWRSSIYPPDVKQCQIKKIELEGSDLHDKGLGALFVTYEKPNDDQGMFPNQASVKVVIKPEDRSIEMSLFGTQEDSLANQINKIVGLDPSSAITTIKMQTHKDYGSLVEFVKGQQARKIKGTGDPNNPALTEGIAFAFLSGMSDVHQDNVIWGEDGKPYFIDADNTLNLDKLKNPQSQTGFSQYSKEGTKEAVKDINDPSQSKSEIIKAMKDPTKRVKIIDAIRKAYTGKKGRVVPVYTNWWAQQVQAAATVDEGNRDDDIATIKGADSNAPWTLWAIANYAAPKVLEGGKGGTGEGLKGECGTSSDPMAFNTAEEQKQIKADLEEGKIPFYEYVYTSGEIKHNDKTIWKGQSLNDAMKIIEKTFPKPKD